MKIKVKNLSYEEVEKQPFSKHKWPARPSKALAFLIRTISKGELKAVNFSWTSQGMEKLGKKEPCLILMNHSSFIDLKIAHTIFKGRPLQIVCTSDGFVGKNGLMRKVGCIPTQKFVTDFQLVKDMLYCTQRLKTSILMYPEASYSFDGTATPLPQSLGKMLKLLNVSVVFVETFGAFARDPLYNGLRLRNTNVSAKVKYLLSPQEIQEKSVDELNNILKNCYSFDYFKWQKENNIKITENFRSLGLERVLYKCPVCLEEGKTKGEGIKFVCKNCNSSWEMEENGQMKIHDGTVAVGDKDFDFAHIPSWYKWERQCVRKEIEDGIYRLDIPVEIIIMKNTKAVYRVGEGRLIHDVKGFTLTGCDGKLNYSQDARKSYSLYSDYFWYELGDIICIGNNKILYYCFPKTDKDVAAKTRLATEELYKIQRNQA